MERSFATTRVKTTYNAGDVIDVTTKIAAYHGGKFEFRIQDMGTNSDPDVSLWKTIPPLQVVSFGQSSSDGGVDSKPPQLRHSKRTVTEPCAPLASAATFSAGSSGGGSIWDKMWGGSRLRRLTTTAWWNNLPESEAKSIQDGTHVSAFDPAVAGELATAHTAVSATNLANGLHNNWGQAMGDSGTGTCSQIPLGGKGGSGRETIKVKLPDTLTCTYCVMQ